MALKSVGTKRRRIRRTTNKPASLGRLQSKVSEQDRRALLAERSPSKETSDALNEDYLRAREKKVVYELSPNLPGADERAVSASATVVLIEPYIDQLRERGRQTIRSQQAGVEQSAKARRARNVSRDQSIHDKHAAGRSPKQIAGDVGLSVSTVNRILGRPRP